MLRGKAARTARQHGAKGKETGMGFEVMVVTIVGMGLIYELGKRIVERVIQPRTDVSTAGELQALRTEVAALRDELKTMRRENHDLMLAVDDLGALRRGHTLPAPDVSEALTARR